MGWTGRARVAGPLAAYADGLGAELDRLGYSRFTVEAELQLMAHVSGWLEDRGLTVGQLTTVRVEEYLQGSTTPRIIETVHARRAPMIPVSTPLRL